MNRLLNGRMNTSPIFGLGRAIDLSALDLLSTWDPAIIEHIFSRDMINEWQNLPESIGNNSFQRLSYQALDRFIMKRQLELVSIQYPPEISVGDKNIDCSICLEKMKDTMIELACSHKYHGVCIRKWAKNSCPYCRAPIDIHYSGDTLGNEID